MTNPLTTMEEAIAVIAALDIDRWMKRTIYHDIKYGYSFGAINEEALLTRRRNWPLYTYLLPDGSSCHIAGDLLNRMVDNARLRRRAVQRRDAISEPLLEAQRKKQYYNQQSHARVGDLMPGCLAEYGWVDYLAGGPRAAGGDGGGGALAQAPQRRAGAASAASGGTGQEADDTGEGAVADAGGDV